MLGLGDSTFTSNTGAPCPVTPDPLYPNGCPSGLSLLANVNAVANSSGCPLYACQVPGGPNTAAGMNAAGAAGTAAATAAGNYCSSQPEAMVPYAIMAGGALLSLTMLPNGWSIVGIIASVAVGFLNPLTPGIYQPTPAYYAGGPPACLWSTAGTRD